MRFTSADVLRSRLVAALLLLSSVATFGDVRLPKLIGDGMVLQRDARVKIWGWASNGEKVTVYFLDSSYETVANDNGEWEVMLSNLKAGGPYMMRIVGGNSITINDIAVGDVWVCSGQSNMGLPLGFLTSVYQDEIDHSENPFIRQFMVPPGTSFGGRERDFKSGRWSHASPKDVRSFTAVGYFFAKSLYEKYKVPIGLINASLGGSSTEAWISKESIKAFPHYYEEAEKFATPGLIESVGKQDDERAANWNRLLRQNDEGCKDPRQSWFDPKVDASAWDTMHVPGYWAENEFGSVNGVYWFRKEISIPASMTSRPAMLKLGRIVDVDSVFLNGRFVGATGSQYAPRFYKIPEGLLKEGVNTIVVRIINYIRRGGFVPGKRYELSTSDTSIDLEGEWKYRRGAAAEPLVDRLFAGKIPTGLFNTMVAPMLPYRIKGVVWYQGESNTSKACEHYDLFTLLIRDWRQNWHQGDFPFLYVQLPNFVEVNIQTTQYDWAYLRETQLKALAMPATGMAVSIDVGEWNDIHPVNKRDVGFRLALAARKVAYGETGLVYSGPIYSSMKIEGEKIVLAFTNIGSGLVGADNGSVGSFEVCGKDGIFHRAEARIDHDEVIVRSGDVHEPVAARYAWANNPEGANLYNREGLPASPFRTSGLY